MKEFIHTIRQMFLVSWGNIMSYVLYSLLGGIAGITVTLGGWAINGGGEDYGQIGALMAVAMGLIINIFAGSLEVEQVFNMAISMGKTRSSFTLSKYLLQALNIMLIWTVAVVIGLIEDVLYPLIYPGVVCGFCVIDVLLQPEVFVFVTLGGALLVLFLGALILRFTTKVYGVFAALWIIACLLISKISEAIAQQQNNIWGKLGQSYINWIENITTFQVAMIGVCVLGAGFAICFALLRRQQVTR